MSGSQDEPRWPRDSAEEAAEVHRADELERLAAWAREQRLRPLTDALEAHGLTRREDRESWGEYVVPVGWAQAEPPEHACPWCQRPAQDDVMCAGCCDAQAASPDPDAQAASPDPEALLDWWRSLSPLGRRLHLCATHGTDPWTGQQVRIGYRSVTTGQEGLAVSHTPLVSRPPRSSWDALA